MGLVDGYSSSDDEPESKSSLQRLVQLYNRDIEKRTSTTVKSAPNNDTEPDGSRTTNDVQHKKETRKKKRTSDKTSYDDFEYEGPWNKKKKNIGLNEINERNERNELNQVELNDTKDPDEYTPDSSKEDNEKDENSNDNDNGDVLASWSQFVGTSETDYLGRSYLHVPQDLPIKLTRDPYTSHECFVPKRIVHTFGGRSGAHAGGVNKLEWFPVSGHLFLSCGNDCSIKLWDFYHQQELLRVFHGHSLPVKDVVFNSTGTQFLSCGYDKLIRLWDTLTGSVLKTISVAAIPNAIRFHPNIDSQFIVGLSNKNIEHYDLSIPEFTTPIQVYDHHQGSINSLTIVDDGNRFMLTSDDKTVRFWDWQINIPVKFISDPGQHSMPLAKTTPDGRYIALQSMDNTIHVIQGHGKYKFNRAKTFTGHITAGYGIGIDISPDGKIIMSGDSKGYAFFWDWKTAKLVRKLKLDTKTVSCIAFHPQESSKVLVAGLSGKIYCCD